MMINDDTEKYKCECVCAYMYKVYTERESIIFAKFMMK
jgi:hypothetical protein